MYALQLCMKPLRLLADRQAYQDLRRAFLATRIPLPCRREGRESSDDSTGHGRNQRGCESYHSFS
jgi:hypothetical protein